MNKYQKHLNGLLGRGVQHQDSILMKQRAEIIEAMELDEEQRNCFEGSEVIFWLDMADGKKVIIYDNGDQIVNGLDLPHETILEAVRRNK